jgi:hypothetical protein
MRDRTRAPGQTFSWRRRRATQQGGRLTEEGKTASPSQRPGARGRQQAAPVTSSPSDGTPRRLHDSGEATRWRIDGSGRARVRGGGGPETRVARVRGKIDAAHAAAAFIGRGKPWSAGPREERGAGARPARRQGRRDRVRPGRGLRWVMTTRPHMAAGRGGGGGRRQRGQAGPKVGCAAEKGELGHGEISWLG